MATRRPRHLRCQIKGLLSPSTWKAFVRAGGLASGGFPVQYRTYDELFAWDGASDEWVLESKMPERRIYVKW